MVFARVAPSHILLTGEKMKKEIDQKLARLTHDKRLLEQEIEHLKQRGLLIHQQIQTVHECWDTSNQETQQYISMRGFEILEIDSHIGDRREDIQDLDDKIFNLKVLSWSKQVGIE